MNLPAPNKSSVEEIRERFDNDVERFSNLDTGQRATVDAPLVLDLIVKAASSCNPDAASVLDIGCGAGNYSLKLLQALPNLEVTGIDLSRPMLERARERIEAATEKPVILFQGDIREVELGEESYDIAMAAAVLHHLRTDDEWETVFAKIYRSLRPGGSFWISDLVKHDNPAIDALIWKQYADYLDSVGGEEYRNHVLDYIEKEDTPRSVAWQLDLMRKVGFDSVEVLHKNTCFAAFGGLKKR